MKTGPITEHLIPRALLEQIEALAAVERRPASDMLREGAIQSDAITRRISVIRRAGSDLRRLGHFC